MTDHVIRITLLDGEKVGMSIDIEFDNTSDSIDGFLQAVKQISDAECYEHVVSQIRAVSEKPSRLQ